MRNQLNYALFNVFIIMILLKCALLICLCNSSVPIFIIYSVYRQLSIIRHSVVRHPYDLKTILGNGIWYTQLLWRVSNTACFFYNLTHLRTDNFRRKRIVVGLSSIDFILKGLIKSHGILIKITFVIKNSNLNKFFLFQLLRKNMQKRN